MKTQSKTEQLIEALEGAGFEPRSYSGRGMYGAECVAAKGDEFAITEALAGQGFGRPLADQLGKGVIVYWPQHKWPEDQDD